MDTRTWIEVSALSGRNKIPPWERPGFGKSHDTNYRTENPQDSFGSIEHRSPVYHSLFVYHFDRHLEIWYHGSCILIWEADAAVIGGSRFDFCSVVIFWRPFCFFVFYVCRKNKRVRWIANDLLPCRWYSDFFEWHRTTRSKTPHPPLHSTALIWLGGNCEECPSMLHPFSPRIQSVFMYVSFAFSPRVGYTVRRNEIYSTRQYAEKRY